MRSKNSKAVDFIEMFANFLKLQTTRAIFIHISEGQLCVFISNIFRELLQHQFEVTQTKIPLFGFVEVAKHSLEGKVVLHDHFVEFLEALFYFHLRNLLLVCHIMGVADCASQAQSFLVGRIVDGDSILFKHD